MAKYRHMSKQPGDELVECLRCGAVVVLRGDGDVDTHAEWHALERRLIEMAHPQRNDGSGDAEA